MPEKRKASVRLRNEAAKRKNSTPAAATPLEDPQESEPPEEPLPTKINDDSPLPTILHGLTLGDQRTQTISESGVLAEAMSRSHQVWLADNLFEHFWAKPSKSKKWVEPPNNPAKDSMTRVGTCRIVIAPHLLDATLYAVKGPNLSASTKTASKTPVTQSSPQVPNGTPIPAQPQSTPSTQPKQTQQQAQASSAKQAAPDQAQSVLPSAAAERPTPGTTQPQKPVTQPVIKIERPAAQKSAPAPAPPPVAAPAPAPTQIGTPQPAQKAPEYDPVIQMLAQRASTNPELKLLMKIVASGGASSEQLKTFQGHIDELTEIIKRNKNQTGQNNHVPQQPQPQQPQPQSQSQPPHRPEPALAPQKPATPSQPAKFKPSGYQQNTFAATPPVKTVTPKAPKYEVVGAVLEFNEPGASGDRYSFPRNSILELKADNELIASFFLIRKPKSGSGAKYKRSEEYYQPVTLRIYSESPKVFDTLAKAVAPPDEVRKHMEDIMKIKKRAEHVQLLLQLPVETDEMDVDTSGRNTPIKAGQFKTADRRASTIGAPLNSNPEEKTGAWQARHCQFCLKIVPSAGPKEDGKGVCEDCGNLRRNDQLKHPFEYADSAIGSHMKHEGPSISGPQSLTL